MSISTKRGSELRRDQAHIGPPASVFVFILAVTSILLLITWGEICLIWAARTSFVGKFSFMYNYSVPPSNGMYRISKVKSLSFYCVLHSIPTRSPRIPAAAPGSLIILLKTAEFSMQTMNWAPWVWHY